MKNKKLLLINLSVIALISVLNVFYQLNNFSFVLKCVCSALFATLGVINLVWAQKKKAEDIAFYRLQSAALILAMLGDILIGVNFILGAATFALGHIVFIMSYSTITKFRAKDLLIGIVLFIPAGSFVLFYPRFDFGGQVLRIVCVLYALIISMMLAKAIGNYLKSRNKVNTCVLFGSILFFISDIMLALNRFASVGKWASHACMGTYYPALCLLALAMCLKICSHKKSSK